jgi:phage terminase large subunit-like protein
MPALSKQPLTEQERKNLLLLLQEAQARGIELPPEAKLALVDKKKKEWPLGPNGYFVKNDGKLYKPSPTHEAFIKSNARYVMLYGPRGCGKSGAGAQKAIFKVKQGLDGIISNPDFENLKISTWPEFKRWIPWDMVIPSQRHRQSDAWQPTQPFMMAFINGAKVYIKGGKDSSSSRGPNVNWFWYDEGGRDETGLSWQITNAGVRVGDNPQAWCTETPRPTEHWSYKFFIKQDIPEEAKQEFEKATKGDRILVEYFHATREDNSVNLDATFYASLSVNYPSGWLRAQEFDGEFANEGGKVGDRCWFKDKILDTPPDAKRKVRFWDLAATEKKTAKDDPDEAVGSLISLFSLKDMKGSENNYCIEDQVGGFWSWENLLIAIATTARRDGPDVPIVLEEEPGSGGKNQVAAVQAYFKSYPELSYYTVVGQRARDVGDRVMAANHWFGQASAGNMWLVRGAWNEKFLAQLDGFTQIEHDDRVTSVTGGMTYLRPFKSWRRVPFLSV